MNAFATLIFIVLFAWLLRVLGIDRVDAIEISLLAIILINQMNKGEEK